MRIDGAWRLCEDKIVRPVVRGEIKTADGAWLPVYFLVDVGADRTVLSADVLASLQMPAEPTDEKLEGVGGAVESVTVATPIRLTRETGATILINGPFAAFTDPKALDMSVLGRDLTNLFALIVDRPQDVVCMLGAKHRYVIVES